MRAIGRWKLAGRLPSPVGLHRGVAEERGAPAQAEWIALDPQNAARPDLCAAFARIHDAVMLVPPCEGLVIPVFRERHHVVRPLLHRNDSARVRVPDDYETVLGIAAKLWPAMRAVAEAVGGSVHPRDIALHPKGHLVVAPTGLVTPRGRWAADAFRAPELNAGSTEYVAAMAYSLGGLLAFWLSAQEATSQTLAAVIDHASDDERVIALLRGLTAHEPTERLRILDEACSNSAGAVFNAAEHQDDIAGVSPARTVANEKQRHVGVVLTPQALRALRPEDVLVIARLSRLPPPVIQRCQAGDVPLVLAQCAGVAEAKRILRELEDNGVSGELVRDLAGDPTTPARWPTGAFACLAGGIGLVIGGPLVGVIGGACGALVGRVAFGRKAESQRMPYIWRSPPGTEEALALTHESRSVLGEGQVSTMGAVLIGDALRELEDALVASPFDRERAVVAERSLRRNMEHAFAAEREVAQHDRRVDP